MNADCIFCKIISRDISANIVKETADLLAFVDIHPMAPTHILVVPKEHIASINDMQREHRLLLGDMIFLAQSIATEHNIEKSGFRLVINTGKGAGQSVFHIHLHLLGGRPMSWPPG